MAKNMDNDTINLDKIDNTTSNDEVVSFNNEKTLMHNMEINKTLLELDKKFLEHDKLLSYDFDIETKKSTTKKPIMSTIDSNTITISNIDINQNEESNIDIEQIVRPVNKIKDIITETFSEEIIENDLITPASEDEVLDYGFIKRIVTRIKTRNSILDFDKQKMIKLQNHYQLVIVTDFKIKTANLDEDSTKYFYLVECDSKSFIIQSYHKIQLADILGKLYQFGVKSIGSLVYKSSKRINSKISVDNFYPNITYINKLVLTGLEENDYNDFKNDIQNLYVKQNEYDLNQRIKILINKWPRYTSHFSHILDCSSNLELFLELNQATIDEYIAKMEKNYSLISFNNLSNKLYLNGSEIIYLNSILKNSL